MSSRFLDFFDRAWHWWTVLCGVAAVAGVCFIATVWVRQSREDERFVGTHLRPLAHFVETFREARGRLPTGAEFKTWVGEAHVGEAAEYYPQKPPFVSEWGTPGRDFIVGASRGEWMHYYQSWNGRDFAGEIAPLGGPAPPHR